MRSRIAEAEASIQSDAQKAGVSRRRQSLRPVRHKTALNEPLQHRRDHNQKTLVEIKANEETIAMKSFAAALAIASALLVSPSWADETPFLLERKIPLGEVRGRID